MANQEHLDILKQGVEVWNQWRKEYPNIIVDLIEANFREVELSGANFKRAKLGGANLKRADLISTNFTGADLREADLRDTDLRKASFKEANLFGVDFSRADLINANLQDADLSSANFNYANLRGANLSGANLTRTNLNFANLNGTNFNQATAISTIFGDVDLRQANGLETVNHLGASTIGIVSLYRANSEIPEIFLRGVGISDSFIDFLRSLPIQHIDYYTCFISYSSQDQAFAEILYSDLQSKGVRCWFAPVDMQIGGKIRSSIDEAIRMHDKLLLVLSEQSIESTWVEKEVETAFEKERLHGRLVLFPVRLDDAVMHTAQAWAADIRRTRHIGDFRIWKNHDDYQRALNRLLHDLKAEG